MCARVVMEMVVGDTGTVIEESQDFSQSWVDIPDDKMPRVRSEKTGGDRVGQRAKAAVFHLSQFSC